MRRISIVLACLLLILGMSGCAGTPTSSGPKDTPRTGSTTPRTQKDTQLPADDGTDIVWTVEHPESWPSGLLTSAKSYVAEHSALQSMILEAPELVETSDGEQWAVFGADTVQPGYDSVVVVMKRVGSEPWTGVDMGTGIARSDVLPEELVDTDFASDSGLEDY